MQKASKVIKFGEEVQGYTISVLNEREIRASAGLFFLVLFTALMFILFKNDFLLVKYVIVTFLTDFIIRVFVSPRFSPSLIIGRFIVSRQAPEYVGAPQKKFAWKIGLALSCVMFFLMIILNSYSIITGLICLICLLFLFFESAFGICLGCLFYPLFYKNEVKYCAGEVCEKPEKQIIQKISLAQVLIVFGFIAFIILTIYFFHAYFSIAPKNLKEVIDV